MIIFKNMKEIKGRRVYFCRFVMFSSVASYVEHLSATKSPENVFSILNKHICYLHFVLPNIGVHPVTFAK